MLDYEPELGNGWCIPPGTSDCNEEFLTELYLHSVRRLTEMLAESPQLV